MKKIVFLGDSITAGFKWTKSLENAVNLAVGGYKTTELIPLVKETRLEKPDILFLMIGINDILCNERFFENGYTIPLFKSYDLLLDLLRVNLPRTKIYLLSTLPIRTRENLVNPISCGLSKKLNSNIDHFNEWIEMRANSYQCEYIDINRVFKDENDELSESLTIDGIHLNETGYDLLKSNIIKFTI